MENKIVEFNEFEAKLSEFKSNYDGVVYDLTNKTINKQARSDRLTIGKVIAELDRRHKAVKEPLKAKVDLIDGERKRIKDQLLSIQLQIKSQIEEYEEKERQRIEKEKLDKEISAAWDIAHEEDKLWEREQAIKLAEEERARKEEEARLKAEAEQRERDRLAREKELKEQAAKEAREKAIREAEERARKEKEAAEWRELQLKFEKEQAEREKAEAERKAAEAKDRAEREAKEAHEAKLKAEAEEQAKREADKAHRKQINNKAKADLIANGFNDKDATRVITVIAKGLISNVTIKY